MPFVLGVKDKITLQNLENNPGLIPLKLGTAKIQEQSHTLIHYYDLNPIIAEINKLGEQSTDLINKVETSTIRDYHFDTSEYLKILNLTKEKVENKIKEILPHPLRSKRGLINGLGSIFKSISGNLDASDGEHYEKLISELQNNQNKLSSNIIKSNSVSVEIINKFNQTVRQITHNEELLQSRINSIASILEQRPDSENSMFLKDTFNQIIKIYEVINSVLQDVENSITFSKLNIVHPSIVQNIDLYNELIKLEKSFNSEQLPIKITLANTLLIRDIIEIDSYIFKNKITYLLKIPIMHPQYFEYFRLYSIPVLSQSQFKMIISNNKYLLKNELYYTFESDICREILPQYYICKKSNIQINGPNSPCEVQLIDRKNISICQQINVKMAESLTTQLKNSLDWVAIFPKKETINLKCKKQEEFVNVVGTYLISIPIGCRVLTRNEKLVNEEPVLFETKPILFPNLEITKNPTSNLTLRLEDIKLEDLQEIKRNIVDNQPQLSFSGIYHIPSFWTILLYIAIISTATYIGYKKMYPKFKSNEEFETEVIELPNVQLPRRTP